MKFCICLAAILSLFFAVTPAPAQQKAVVVPLGGAAGDAAASDVRAGRIFSNREASGIAGSMPNNGGMSFTPGTTAQTIPEGFHDGTGTVAGDSDLIFQNIKLGKAIFGVSGRFATAWGCRYNEETGQWAWSGSACNADCFVMIPPPASVDCPGSCGQLESFMSTYGYAGIFCNGPGIVN